MENLMAMIGIVLIAIVACIILFLIDLGALCILIFIFASMFILILAVGA
jgi:hypothetical protein